MMKKILAMATAAAVISGLAGLNLVQASCHCKQSAPVVQQSNQCCQPEKSKCPINKVKKHKKHKAYAKHHMTGAACPVRKRNFKPVTCTPYQKLCPNQCCPAAPVQNNSCGCGCR